MYAVIAVHVHLELDCRRDGIPIIPCAILVISKGTKDIRVLYVNERTVLTLIEKWYNVLLAKSKLFSYYCIFFLFICLCGIFCVIGKLPVRCNFSVLLTLFSMLINSFQMISATSNVPFFSPFF